MHAALWSSFTKYHLKYTKAWSKQTKLIGNQNKKHASGEAILHISMIFALKFVIYPPSQRLRPTSNIVNCSFSYLNHHSSNLYMNASFNLSSRNLVPKSNGYRSTHHGL
eukprot:TRINITY_DN664_c0_g3_i2.p1 TRINITY_DN664_c0_g3~~TRINITY_DN664_c0_g3_i2.p1  ORF type:complete len:109 (-),score=4.32 TRINITY_DN664_c0_g3_i2:148-474(-)